MAPKGRHEEDDCGACNHQKDQNPKALFQAATPTWTALSPRYWYVRNLIFNFLQEAIGAAVGIGSGLVGNSRASTQA